MPLVLVAYVAAPPRARNGVLAVLSVLFYVWGAHEMVALFLASIGFNYAAGRLIHRFRERGDERAVRRTMWAAVAANLALLIFWKYATFAIAQLDRAVGFFDADG